MGLLEDYVWWLTPVINGTLGLFYFSNSQFSHNVALLAGCLSFKLPETNNQPMTTTIEEFETKYGRAEAVSESKEGLDNAGFQEDKL